MQNVPDAPVELADYVAAWPVAFEVERAQLESILAPWLAGRIEHIGSTAVPGLCAKPVIDIMAPLHSLDASRPVIDAAVAAGYVYAAYKVELMHWFCKPSPGHRTHHLHLLPLDSALWQQRLALRDALRRSPALAGEYAALKRQLAARFRFDREAYTEAKGPFIERVLGGCAATGAAPMTAAPPPTFSVAANADRRHCAGHAAAGRVGVGHRRGAPAALATRVAAPARPAAAEPCHG